MIYLVGTKCDKEAQREVSSEMVEEFVDLNGIKRAFEVSAKTNYNVEELFAQAMKDLMK